MLKRVSSLVLLLVLLVASAIAQTPTGIMQGTVYDQSQAVVPGATVRVVNLDTNEAKLLTTDATGHYIQPFLSPGTYTVTVEAKGFKTTRQENVKVDVATTRTVDITLVVGTTATEIVEVTGAPPALDVNTSTVGTAIENRSVVDLPLNGRNVFALATLTPSVISSSGGEATPHMGGSRNAVSEVQLDGGSIIAPENNTGINVRVYTPPIDAVQEFTVQINNLSAEYGRFGGGVINMVTKSGTNDFHGTGYGFFRNSVLNASDFFSGGTKPDTHDYQYGGSIGGPLFVPKVYNGKNKTFFFFDYQGERAVSPNGTYTMTTPTNDMRAGNFSGAGYTIYDPSTGHACAVGAGCPDGWTRNPFPNNTIAPSQINPVAAAAIKYFPQPNVTGQGYNFSNAGVTPNTGYSLDGRLDHSFNDKWHMFFRISHGSSQNSPPNNFGDPALIAAEWSNWNGGGPSTNSQWNSALDTTISISPTLIADFRWGFGRSSSYRTPYSDGFDISTLGMPGALAGAAQTKEFPRFELYGNGTGGNENLGNEGWSRLYMVPQVQDVTANITKIYGRHTIKTGMEFRKLFMNFAQYAYPTGRWGFDNTWTQQNPQSGGGGSGIASFLTGVPSWGGQEIDPTPATASGYWAAYVQDDFKVTNKLTLNLGLRWDVDLPRTERYNQLTYFDTSLPSPLAGQVAPNACPACGGLAGAMVFVGTQDAKYGRSQVPTQWHDFGPRIGLAYNLAPGWVIRTGFGIAYAPSAFQAAGSSGGAGMDGFLSQTGWTSSIDGGRTPFETLSTAFTGGANAINFPLGATGGAATNLGYGISASLFNAVKPTYSEQWNFNVQHEFGNQITLEAGYIGNKGVHLPFGNNSINLSQLPVADMALGSNLNTLVANPFYGLPNSGAVGANPQVTYGSLIGAWPQYQNVSSFRKPMGNSQYHGFTLKLDKRFSHGLALLMAYSFQKTMSDTDSAVGFLGQVSGGPLDAYNLRNEWAVDAQNVRQAFVTSGVYDLPFGKGKAFLNSAPKGANLIVSGWQLNGIVTLSQGLPIPIGCNACLTNGIGAGQRVSSTGQSAQISDQSLARWFNTSVFTVPAAYSLGNLARTLPDVTGPGVSTADLSLFKNNYFGRDNRYNAQFRTEWFNAFNHPQFGMPGTGFGGGNFGQITGTSGNDSSRVIQMAVKFIF
jgi:hypothetical protein